MLTVSNLTVRQGERFLWRDFSLRLAPGERLGIAAPSGFGKTTLGRVLAGWQPADAGEILLDGRPLLARGYCPVQLVPQHPELTFNPYRTTGRSLRDAWQPDGAWPGRFAVQEEWLSRRPHQLSGGELARIALLRALGPHTRVLIADEVTAQLDPRIQQAVWQELLIESRQRPLGMIVFSHQQALLEQVCHRIIHFPAAGEERDG